MPILTVIPAGRLDADVIHSLAPACGGEGWGEGVQSENRKGSNLQPPRAMLSITQEGPPNVRLRPAAPGFTTHGDSPSSITKRWLCP